MNLTDDKILLTVIILSLLFLLLLAVVLMVLASSQKSKLKHKAEKERIEQEKLLEVEKAEKEAIQNTLSEVGRELHDNVGQLLTAAQLGLMNHFGEQLDKDHAFQEILRLMELAIDEVSQMGRAMNSDFWKNLDFFDAVTLEASRLEKLGTFVVHIHQHDEKDGLSEQERIMMYRVFQEVIRNAMKHAKADLISVSMRANPFEVILSDNGMGFNVDEHSAGSGIKNILHRTSLVGIQSTLTSDENGTTWKFMKP
jgi:two-component system, NarL family, sensor kinase